MNWEKIKTDGLQKAEKIANDSKEFAKNVGIESKQLGSDLKSGLKPGGYKNLRTLAKGAGVVLAGYVIYRVGKRVATKKAAKKEETK